MAVIISSNDPIPTNTTSQGNNDTSWMQDLVVEAKPEIVEKTVEVIKPVTEDTVVEVAKEIEAPKIIETTPIVVPETRKDPIITNMYIAADQANATNSEPKQTTNTPIANSTTEIKTTNPKAINLDDLFGNTKTTEAISYEAPSKEAMAVPIQTEQKTQNDSHTLQKIVFGLAWSLAVIAGAFFIIKTVFPLTFNNPTPTETIIDTGTIVEQAEEIHTAPPAKTLEEVYTDKLTAYASSGEYYHQFGRETKNRNLIRYGLFIHKKSLDLQDDIQKAIVLSGQIDTVSIEAYLAQFDEYVGILEETVANDPDLQTALNAFTGPSSEAEDNGNFAPQASETGQNTGEQMNTQPTLDQFLNQVTQPQ